MGGSILGMLPLAIFRVSFFCSGENWLEATSRVDMGHILGPESHVCIAILVRFLVAMTMGIWDRECGPFGQFSLFLPY